MKKRSQIKDKYKWNLDDLASSDDKALQDLKEIEKFVDTIPSYKGKLGNKSILLKYLSECTENNKQLEIIGCYFHLKWCEDVASVKYNKIMGELQNLSRKIGINSAFENSELLSYGEEYLTNIISDKKFVLYKKSFEELLRSKPHVLNEESSKLMAKVGHFADDFGEIFDKFDAVDIKFCDVLDSKGKSHKLTNSNFANYLESKDRILRNNTWNNFYKAFMDMSNTIGTNYIGNVKSDVAYANIYNYNSTLESELFDDNINPKIYDKLIENINKYTPLLHRYYKLKKKALGLKDFGYADSYVTLSKYNPNFTYEQGVTMSKEALAPLGENYVNLVQKAVDERWIDVYPTQNKTTGGFCTGGYLVHPYILLNNEGRLDDVFTFIHEIGHAMHSYHSNETQPYTLADYPIVLAEIASTSNEVLLLKYLYSKATSKNEKIYYLDKYLKMFKSTIFRQTMFSEFEDYAHKSVEAGNALTVQTLCEYYGNLNKKYHGKAIKHCKEIEFEWLRIPHFYNSYYVYKYSTGMISAICLMSNILNGVDGAYEKYFSFLKAGGSDYPMNTLARAGVDLSTDEPYEIAFAEMKWALDELSKLI